MCSAQMHEVAAWVPRDESLEKDLEITSACEARRGERGDEPDDEIVGEAQRHT